MSELDFAGSLSGEFRGMQDAGWSTTITAEQVFEELNERLAAGPVKSLADMRIILLLYSQLSEAGGVYENLKNMMGIVENAPYSLWPFRDLVRVRKNPNRVIGPNANATFRDLATHALWRGQTGDDLLDLLYKGIVRAPMLIDAQASDAKRAIINHIRTGAEAFRDAEGITMRWPYLVARATKV
ncbi:MAG: hypothetical protein K8H74_09260 [Notoacmeibacter sp.]|nr:hypothetical protein [Notoacmeibacter sp.]